MTDANKYRMAVEMSLDAIVSAEEDGTITLWNPAAGRIFGYTEEEAAGKNISTLIPEEYRERHGVGFRRFLETGEGPLIGKTAVVEGLKKDGERFHAELSLAAEVSDGRWVFTVVIKDITERKSLEDELRKNLKDLETLNKFLVRRELKMEELRREIKRLKERLGEGA